MNFTENSNLYSIKTKWCFELTYLFSCLFALFFRWFILIFFSFDFFLGFQNRCHAFDSLQSLFCTAESWLQIKNQIFSFYFWIQIQTSGSIGGASIAAGAFDSGKGIDLTRLSSSNKRWSERRNAIFGIVPATFQLEKKNPFWFLMDQEKERTRVERHRHCKNICRDRVRFPWVLVNANVCPSQYEPIANLHLKIFQFSFINSSK